MKRIVSLCMIVTLALASLTASACKPGNENGNSNSGGNSEAVDKLFVGLRLALAGSGPLLSLLVNQGKLSAEKAAWIREDFAAAVAAADTLRADIAAATDSAGRLAAAQKAYQGFKAIYEKGHFGLDPTVLAAANIAEGIFAAIVGLYGGSAGPTPVGAPRAPVSAATDDEKRAAIQAQIDDLSRTLAVK